ncbi:MAG TPA: hypothetical protein VJQ43_01700, partial [Thermoplasmata archaeon]|nr:hypothetical protein [Thermoplasmata archaeon]
GQRTLLLVRTANGSAPFSYSYSGLPAGCSSQDVPTLPCLPTGAGTFRVQVQVRDGGGSSASASLTVTVTDAGGSGAVRITGFAILPSTIVLGNSTTLSVNASGGSGGWSYAYGNLPAGCASSNVSSLGCAPTVAGTFAVTFSVRDGAGGLASVSGNLTVDPVGSGSGLAISGFGPSPGMASLGATVVLSVVASGGTGPLTYQYPVLPSGCVSANTSALPCVPAQVGTYPLYVKVSDAGGHLQGAVGALVVVPATGPAPSVSAFFATVTNVSLGNSTTLVVEARGLLPLQFAYSGLPNGCRGDDASVLNCTPTATGEFGVTVTVTDSLGRTSRATTSFHVSESSRPKGPANPLTPAGSGEPVVLDALVGIVIGAVVALAALELYLARRRTRQEGEAIVRELNRRSAEESGPAEPPRP